MAGRGNPSRASRVHGGTVGLFPSLLAALVFLLALCAFSAGCTSPPRPGSVSVSSLPPGAAVYLDGTYQGTTPVEIANLTPGTHLVRLRMEGYGDREMAIVVEAGNRTSVTASYPPLPTPTPTPVVTTLPTTPPLPFVITTPAPGALSLRTFPLGATVAVNGIPMGITPLVIQNLTPGTYHVRYSLVGWDDYDSVVSVSSGQTMTDDVILRR
ncbi:MAG: PEGA domain-containing protein [Methanomicrobiales archaeon]|nr:PEGA domain-containing protein [Methanomicrobiales archaeon]